MNGIIDIDWELAAALEDLVGEGELEEGTKEHGIALKVMHEGYDSLSRKQKFIFDIRVVPLLDEHSEEQYWAERAASAAP